MMRIVNHQGQPAQALLNRAQDVQRDVSASVAAILEQVRLRGDAAALDYCEAFDGVRPDGLLVPPEDIEAAYRKLDADLIATMERAARQIERFHSQQKRPGFSDMPAEGVVVGQRVLRSAGEGRPGARGRDAAWRGRRGMRASWAKC